MFMSALRHSKASWTYNWNVSASTSMLNKLKNDNINFCPCIWNENFKIDRISELLVKPKFILGYNEPDQKSQANMSIDKILKNWEELTLRTPKDIMLVAPAISDGHFDFQRKLYDALASSGLRFDAIGLHYYREDLLNFSKNNIPFLADRYDKKVVISEFGFIDWANKRKYLSINDKDKEKIVSQIINTCEFYEVSDEVAGYCIYPSYSASTYHGDMYNTFNMLENNKETLLFSEYSKI